MNREETIHILAEMNINRCTPEIISSLQPCEVFVFGTDPEGNHKSSAAKLAVKQFGAQMGKGEGLFGQSYAIPVHKHRTWKMAEAISRFVEFAKSNRDKKFLVLAIGCGAAGMDVAEVSIMFKKAIEVDNISLPSIFIDGLKDYFVSGCFRRANNLSATVKECLSSIKRNGYSPKGKIAMTRDYGFILDDEDKQIFVGDSSRCHLKKLKTYSRIVSVAGTFSDEVGLTANGKIVSSIKSESSFSDFDLTILRRECGRSSVDMMLRNLDEHQFDVFQNVKSISAGEGHIVGVKQDGSVICWDGQGGWEGVPDFKSKVKEWQNIRQVAVGYENIVALTYNGKILGSDEGFYECYHDFIQVDAYGHYYGDCYSMALRSNGTVLSPNYEGVSAWHDIVQIACGWDVALGLRRDGKVEIASPFDNEIIKIVSSWKNIVNVECKFSQIIAISADSRIYSIYIH